MHKLLRRSSFFFFFGSDPNTNSIKGFKWNPIKANSSAYLNISNAGFQQGCGYVEEKNKIWKDLSKYFN